MKLSMLYTFVETPISLIAYIIDDRGFTPLLLTQKPRYSVSVCLENDFSAFNFNPASSSLCSNFSNAFMWSLS